MKTITTGTASREMGSWVVAKVHAIVSAQNASSAWRLIHAAR